MAEAIVNAREGFRWHAYSAGTRPDATVSPNALRVLSELDIVHEGRPKHVSQFRHEVFDLVVTLCDSAESECPSWVSDGRTEHLGFPDPTQISGTDKEILVVYRSVRDDIGRRVKELLDALMLTDESKSDIID